MDISNEETEKSLMKLLSSGNLVNLDGLTPEQSDFLEKHLRSEIPSYISQDLDLVGLLGVYNQRLKCEMREKLKAYVENSITSRLFRYCKLPKISEPDFENLSKEEEWELRNNLDIKIELMIHLGYLSRNEIPYNQSFKDIFKFVNQREEDEVNKRSLAHATSMSKMIVSIGENLLNFVR